MPRPPRDDAPQGPPEGAGDPLAPDLAALPGARPLLDAALTTRGVRELHQDLRGAWRDGARPDDLVAAIADHARDRLAELPAPERDAIAALSVLAAPATRAAAVAVLRAALGDAHAAEPLLAALVGRGLVVRRGDGPPTLLEAPAAVGAGGRAALAADPELRRRSRSGVLDYWVAIAAEHRREWFGPDQLDRYARLDAELPTLVDALPGPDAVEAARILGVHADLWSYWNHRSSGEARRRILDALGRAGGAADDDLRFRGHWTAAWLMLDDDELVGIDGQVDALAALARTPDQRADLAQIRGLRALYEERPAEAGELLAEAWRRHRTHGEDGARFVDLSFAAVAASASGDAAAAYAHCEAALALADRHGERIIRNYVVWAFALSAWRDHDRHRAYVLALDGLHDAVAVDDQHAGTICLEVIAWYCAAAGDAARAATVLGAADRLRLGHRLPPPYLGTVGAHRGAMAEALRALGPTAYRRAFQHGRTLDLAGIAELIERWLDEPADAEPSLSPRQREIAGLIASGLTNKEIAQRLLITVRTVETHIEHIFEKLDVVSRAQVAAWAARH